MTSGYNHVRTRYLCSGKSVFWKSLAAIYTFLDTACTEISTFPNFRARRNEPPQVRDPDPGMLHLSFFSRMTPYQRVGGVDLGVGQA